MFALLHAALLTLAPPNEAPIDPEIGADREPSGELAADQADEAEQTAEQAETASDAGEVVELVVESEAEQLRASAAAVDVIETARARREAADLGETLARTKGVGVRRGGGLGSSAQLSLNGLAGDRIRVFLDGIPLALLGVPPGVGLANLPLDRIERVEIYRGVVPIRFGADALGGALNVVRRAPLPGFHGSASYQGGSFATHRAAASAQYLHPDSGAFVAVDGSIDAAANDYPIDVEVSDEGGQLSPARVRRFHDRYAARSGRIALGQVDGPWPGRLLARAFVTSVERDIQHNVVMTVPYGEVETSTLTAGGLLDYGHRIGERVELDLIGGYTWTRTELRDLGECVYDWFGQCVFDRPQPGEIGLGPVDQLVDDHAGHGRGHLRWRVADHHTLAASIAPTFVHRRGRDRTLTDPDLRDPLSARRNVLSLVSGLSYTLDAVDDRLQNQLFAKSYVQVARTEEPLPSGELEPHASDIVRFGIGDGFRYRLTDWLYAKTSYEWATRLPRADELFGDGVRVAENLELQPETSHNLNLNLALDLRETPAGDWRLDLSGFWRETDRLIVLLGDDQLFRHQNVFGARSLGIEASAGWTSVGEFIALDANLTYQDFRNSSDEGPFGDYVGDRIPNRPYLFANGQARGQLSNIAADDDELALTWTTRYVHEFYRGWESIGLAAFKQVVPGQLIHTIGLSYLVRGRLVHLSTSVEVHNLSDAQAFDYFGVQRPGRAVYAKTSVEF